MSINNKNKGFRISSISCSVMLMVFVVYPIKSGWASPAPAPKARISKARKTNTSAPAKSKNKPVPKKDHRKDRDEIRDARHMATLYKKVYKFQKAAKIYHQRAEKMDWLDGKAQYLYFEAQVTWATGNYKKSQDIFAQISKKGAEKLKVYLSQSPPEEEKNKRSRIVSRFWIDIDHASFALANIEQIKGDISRALEIYKTIEKDSPYVENQKRAVFAMAQIEKRKGHFEKSIQLLEKLLTYDENKKATPKTDFMNVDLYGLPKNQMSSNTGLFPPEEGSKSETKKQTYLLLLAKACARAGFLGKAKKTYAEIIANEKKTLEKRKNFFKNSKVPLKLGLMGQIAEKEMNSLQNKP
jgi:tetratricopeptide (TPR) repeat protein